MADDHEQLSEKTLDNLKKIQDWAAEPRDLSKLGTNDEFMTFAVELMNHTLYVARTCAALAPDQKRADRGFLKNEAILAGLVVRAAKLYQGCLIHIAQRQLELAAVFFRMILETALRARYLISLRRFSTRSFVLGSYRPEKEIVADLKAKAARRPLLPIEQRMLSKIGRRLRRDRITQKVLLENRKWGLDGKDVRRLMEDVNVGPMYAYAFGSGSHHIHGDWYELDIYHLRRRGRFYLPKVDYTDPDPRLACPVTLASLNLSRDYVSWRKADPDGFILPIIESLADIAIQLNVAHEAELNT